MNFKEEIKNAETKVKEFGEDVKEKAKVFGKAVKQKASAIEEKMEPKLTVVKAKINKGVAKLKEFGGILKLKAIDFSKKAKVRFDAAKARIKEFAKRSTGLLKGKFAKAAVVLICLVPATVLPACTSKNPNPETETTVPAIELTGITAGENYGGYNYLIKNAPVILPGKNGLILHFGNIETEYMQKSSSARYNGVEITTNCGMDVFTGGFYMAFPDESKPPKEDDYNKKCPICFPEENKSK